MRHSSILIHLFFSTLVVSVIMFCERLLPELMMLLSTYHVTNHLIQLYIDICEIILHLQANQYRLKTKNINSLIFNYTIAK